MKLPGLRHWRLFDRNGWLAGAVLSALVAGACVPVRAEVHEIRDFHHAAWTSENGPGAVFDIQQAPDGYLWLTTAKGVSRFDGVRFQSAGEVTNGPVKDNDIFAMFVSSSGGVWFSTRNAGLLLWKDQRLTAFPDRHCTPTAQIGGVFEDRDGSLWFQAAAGLSHLHGSVCEQPGQQQGYPGGLPAAILVDREGTVWVKASSGALLYRRRGSSKFELSQYVSEPTASIAFLHEASDGSLWLSDTEGLRRINKDVHTPSLVRGQKKRAPFRDFTFTSDGSLWTVTEDGIERFKDIGHSSKIEPDNGENFTPTQGLSSNAVWKVVADREGTLWVATNSGLDRLRRAPLSTIALPPAQEHEFAIAPGEGNSVWVGNNSLPLTHVSSDGEITSFSKTRQVGCVRRDRKGTIWSAGDGDSYLWRSDASGFAPIHYPNETVEPALSLADDRNDQLWVSSRGGGVYHRVGDQWSRQNEALGKKPGVLGAMAGDEAGNVWFAFSNKLVRWDGTSYHKFSFPEGPLNISVGTMAVRGDHVWLAGRGGVVLFTQGHFALMQWKDPAMPGRVSGIVETKTGDLWINSFSDITHVSSAELTRWTHHKNSVVSAERLNALDGLPGLSAERVPEPSVVESPGGRLWFATTKGIAWLDPTTLEKSRNLVPPPVMIDVVVANAETRTGLNHLQLPPHTENLEIDYTALSLAMPERVLFRYKLDGIDKDWQDVGTRRQAFYTSLPPGRYRFHVIASNNSGVWNQTGAVMDFGIQPAFYQTGWFRVACAIAFAACMWLLFRLRLMQVTGHIRERLAAQMAERERIARELHDTILQGFYGILLRFQTAADQVPQHEPAYKIIEDALDRAEGLLDQGRDSIRDLRGESIALMDLSEEFAKLSEDYKSSSLASFSVEIQGTPRTFHPVIRDEIYQIGHEAIVNAFLHANASKIEVELVYDRSWFILRVQDDGRGIDPAIVDAGGRVGHWGMIGMRERSRKIGAQLSLWSRANAGTEMQLKISAKLAYPEKPSAMRWFWKQRPTMASK